MGSGWLFPGCTMHACLTAPQQHQLPVASAVHPPAWLTASRLPVCLSAALAGHDLLAALAAGGGPEAYVPRATTKRQLVKLEGGRGSPERDSAPAPGGTHAARHPGSSGSSVSAHSGMEALDALVAAAEEEEQHEAAAKRQRTATPAPPVEPDPSWFLPQPSATAAVPGLAATASAAPHIREAQASSVGLLPPSVLLAGLPLAPPAGLQAQAAAQQADMQLLLRHLMAPPPPAVPAPLALLAPSPPAAAVATAVALQQRQQQLLQQQLTLLAAAGDPIAAAALQAAAVQQQAMAAQQQVAAAAQRAAQEAHLRSLLLEQERRAAAVQEMQSARLFQAACDAILGSVLAPGRGAPPPGAP